MAKNIYGFEKKTHTTAITVIEIIVIAIFAIAIIAMLSFFFLFSREDAAPKVFGYNIYLSRVTNMAPAIPENTAVFAKAGETDNLEAGNVVLCSVEYNNEKLTTILRIQDIQLEDGVNYYLLKGDTNPANETIRLPQENIIAKGIYTSEWFGKVLSFATSQLGILTVIIIPCILLIIIQVLRIIRLNRIADDYDDDDYNTDDVLFSTLNNKHSDTAQIQIPKEVAAPPVKRLYVGDEGKAEYLKKAVPTAHYDELHETIRSTQNNPMRTPTPASVRLNAQRSTVTSNFTQKPISRDYETASEIYFEKPSEAVERRLDPPVVGNPVDITIPVDAVKPRETIAPPPKKQNNKTVEELMRVIDQAQSGLKK